MKNTENQDKKEIEQEIEEARAQTEAAIKYMRETTQELIEILKSHDRKFELARLSLLVGIFIMGILFGELFL